MPQNASIRGFRSAATIAAACLMTAPVCAQAQSVPPGAPQTAPTTLQGRPVPGLALPAPAVPAASPAATPISQTVAAPPTTGFLGVNYTAHTNANGQTDGAFVVSVVPGSPAAQGGVRPGDLVTAFDDQGIDAGHGLAALVAAQPPGTTGRLSVRRGETSYTLLVQMGLTPHTTLGSGDVFAALIDHGPPPFSGGYRGKYRAVYLPGTGVTQPQTGTLSLTITPGGAVTGSIHTDSGGLDGTVAGTVSGVGYVSLAFTFTAGVSGTMDGLLGLTPGGRLAGTLSQSFGPSPSGTLTWDASR